MDETGHSVRKLFYAVRILRLINYQKTLFRQPLNYFDSLRCLTNNQQQKENVCED